MDIRTGDNMYAVIQKIQFLVLPVLWIQKEYQEIFPKKEKKSKSICGTLILQTQVNSTITAILESYRHTIKLSITPSVLEKKAYKFCLKSNSAKFDQVCRKNYQELQY